MPPRATFRDVFAVREFRALWFSEILSVAGDRLALVALTLLVYERTRSPLFAALTYAAGYLPWVIGGLFLSDLADRRPRRTVMVACDAVRAVLVAAMAVPGVPLVALVALLFATTMFTPPFESARAAITPEILQGERYVLGAAVAQTTFLAAQVAGAVGGGIAVAFIGTQRALAVDSATFVLSGLLIGLGIRARPAAARPETVQSSPLGPHRPGLPPASSATRRCAPCCCSAGWWFSTPFPRGSRPRTRKNSGEGRSRLAWSWRPRCSPPPSRRRCSPASSAPVSDSP